MKGIIATAILLFSVTASAFAEEAKMNTPAAAADAGLLEIFYSDELTNIDVRGARFRFSWKTAPPGAGNFVGPESYVEQVAESTLTPEQKKIFRDWMEKRNVLGLTSPESKGDENAPVAEIYICLSVVSGDRKISLYWTGASLWRDPGSRAAVNDAVEDLKRICAGVARENARRD